MTTRQISTMAKPNPKAKKKLKKIEEEGAKVLNDKDESPIDTIIKDKDEVEEDWNVKTLEVESDTKLEADKGEGQTLTLRHFFFKANQEQFKKHIPTAQELLNSHLKHIEIELWKDGLRPNLAIAPRLAITPDKRFYQIFVTCMARISLTGTKLPFQVRSKSKEKPKRLQELLNDTSRN